MQEQYNQQNNTQNAQYEKHYIISESCKLIKEISRKALKGRYFNAVVAVLAGQLISIGPDLILTSLFPNSYLISLLTGIYGYLIPGAVAVGLASYFLKLFRQEETGIKEIFCGFNYITKCFLLYILYQLVIMGLSLLLVVPGIIAAYRFRFVFLLLSENPEKPVIQCMKESAILTMGNKAKLFKLDLSFMGWYILSALPTMYVSFNYVYSNNLIGITDYTEFANALAVDAKFYALLRISTLAIIFINAYTSTAEVCAYELINGNLVTAMQDNSSEL